jgi:MoaA/NifB/PqqE/SkfB family radical SAM enzyme
MGLVLSNHCNLGCIHCYQAKNSDSLLASPEIGRDLRRELAGFYPYLSTLGLLGGEVFLSPGFEELLADVASMVDRPILRLNTNGTLIDEAWAERIVRTPFRSLTISIDGATAETYRRLRLGGELETVLAGIRRIVAWKHRLGTEFPFLDSFFVIMRSNFREIPQYLEMMRREEVRSVSMETIRINTLNTARTPSLVEDEVICEAGEVAELHGLLRQTLVRERPHFRGILVSGLTTLFAAHGLDSSFLSEEAAGLYPESDDLRPEAGGFELCPNPWTTLFVTEKGDVHLCFLSEPIGNLYERPLAEIWNSPQAVAKRSRMVAGRYLAAACSEPSCSWREGWTAPQPAGDRRKALLAEMKELGERAARMGPPEKLELAGLDAVRRLMASHEHRSLEWEALFRHLCETNGALHQHGQAHIDHLEAELTAAREEIGRLRDAEERLRQENERLRTKTRAAPVRLALRAAHVFDRLAGR